MNDALDSDMPEAGRTISRYVLRGVLGEGAMGRVYLAFDPKFGREVALKVIRDTMLHDERVRKWFHREARAMAQLSHPGIVEVHDYSGAEAEAPFLVMERLHGHTLRDVIDARGVCPPEVLCEIAMQLGVALAHAHGQGLVHRDLKPDNVFVEPTGRIVITDFGLARAQLNVDLGASLASMNTAVVGTPLFMAPETIHDPKTASPRSDLYAVGVLLYYCASLKTPFFGDDPFQTLSRILTGQHTRVHELRKDLPQAIANAIERTFAFDATARPQTGDALEALFGEARATLGGGDSLEALRDFLQQTDQFNSYTQATSIAHDSIAHDSIVHDSHDTAPEPAPRFLTQETHVTGSKGSRSESTVVSRSAALAAESSPNTVVATAPATIAATVGVTAAPAARRAEASPARGRARTYWVLAAAIGLLAVVLAAAFVSLRRGGEPRDARAPAAALDLNPPPPPEPILPTPSPTSVDLPAPPVPDAPPSVPKLPKPSEPGPTGHDDARPQPGKPSSQKAPGTLRVNTGAVWADVLINGEKRGQTPFKPTVELGPGTYRVKLVNPEFASQEFEIAIVSGRVTNLKTALQHK